MSVGLLGGTFDPIHYGHLALAEEARTVLGIERVYLIPSAHQPLKQGKHYASPEQRFEMVQLACQNNPTFIPCDTELHRPPPSYTVDTLRQFRERLGAETRLFFLLGSDALATFDQWHAAGDIIKLAQLVVIARPGTSYDDAIAPLLAPFPNIAERLTWVQGPQLAIASTDLRRRIAEGRSVRYLMPDEVIAYINQRQLYRGEGEQR